MGKKDPEEFVASYTHDNSAISFKWNGKHGENFVDENAAFRSSIIEYVINHPGHVPLALAVDLYRALTEQSAESWSIDIRVEDLGKMMLTAGRSTVARDYLVGAMQSFDAHCGTSFVGCPRDVAEECLALAHSKLESESDENELAIWEVGRARFNLLLEHSC